MPVLEFDFEELAQSKWPQSGLKLPGSVLLTSARMGLAVGIETLGIGAGDKVLAPAYNCPSMIGPIESSGAEVIYYRINQDLSVDLESVREQIDGSVKALLVVHYFGFPQDLRTIRQLCDMSEISLIEDCAHAPFGEIDGSALGSIGDFSVFSLMKFFPVYDGGALRFLHHQFKHTAEPGGWRFEVKMLINAVERACQFNRLRPFNWILLPIFRAKDYIARLIRGSIKSSDPSGYGPGASDGGFAFDPRWKNVRISRFSQLVFEATGIQKLIERRRRNYQFMVEALSGVDGADLVFPILPPSVVPYVLPVLVRDSGRVFPILKEKGVPIYRWEEVASDACPVSRTFSEQLLQLPCHQALRSYEIDWIMATLKDAVGNPRT